MKFDPYKIKWFYGQSRGKNHAVLFIDSVGSLSMKGHYPEEIYNFPYNGKYYLQSNGSRSIGQDDHDSLVCIFDKKLKTDPDFFYKYGVKMEKVANEIRAWTDAIKKTKWGNLTNKSIFEIILKHCDLTAKIWAVPLVYAYYFYFNDFIVENFIKKVRERLGAKLDEIFLALLYQEKLSEVGREKKELLELALRKKGGLSVSAKDIEKHWEKFAHLNNYYYWGHGYSLGDMETRFAEDCKKTMMEIKKEIGDFAAKKFDLKLFTESEQIIIRSMKMMAYSMQYADESLAYAIHNIRGVYNEAAKRLGLTYNQLVSMKLEEIDNSLKKGKSVIPLSELDNRYDDHSIIVIGENSLVLSGEENKRYLAATAQKDDIKASELKGVVAFKGGFLKGKVHIIYHADEITSFKKGEILVTPMTNPSFVPAMQKAKAIITNDGGLLCHAAIVSRELRVPCIIGTKIATKVLKDGDLVDVDADNGVVKIIK